ncbi:MAG: NAD-dependent epimerase/dehydratase family protein, partial [Pedobacter sp.]
DGSCIRDYVHVMDIAKAHVLALRYLENKKNVSEIVNLGTGQGVSVLEAINMFLEVSGTTLNYKIGPAREGDVIEIYSDTSKATELLGWKAGFGLREMMDSAWKWELYMKNEAVTV